MFAHYRQSNPVREPILVCPLRDTHDAPLGRSRVLHSEVFADGGFGWPIPSSVAAGINRHGHSVIRSDRVEKSNGYDAS